MAFGQILGIPAGTVLAGASGFQAPFMIFGGVMVAAWILTMTVLPAVPGQSRTPLGLRSALIGYVDLLRRRDIAAASAASVVMMLGVSLYIVYYPAWLETKLGASPSDIAVMFLFGGLANAVAGPFAGRLSDRIGRRGGHRRGTSPVAHRQGGAGGARGGPCCWPTWPAWGLTRTFWLAASAATRLWTTCSPSRAMVAFVTPSWRRQMLRSTGSRAASLRSAREPPCWRRSGRRWGRPSSRAGRW